jgi:hypothetical protein
MTKKCLPAVFLFIASITGCNDGSPAKRSADAGPSPKSEAGETATSSDARRGVSLQPSASQNQGQLLAEKTTGDVNKKTDPTGQPADIMAEVTEPAGPPATVNEAIKVLDLRTFPVLAGAKLPSIRQVGELIYNAPGKVSEAFEFQRRKLRELGWKELAGSRADGVNPMANFSRDGYILAVSVIESFDEKGAAYVTIQNHGNVPLSRLPVPNGAKSSYAFPTQASYVTTEPEQAATEECRRLLAAAGWKPYGSAEKTMYFKQNAVFLSADVRSHDAQPGKTFITYDTQLLSADLPLPDGVNDPRYEDSEKTLRFERPGAATSNTIEFYKDALAKQGFKPTSEPNGSETTVFFLNDRKDLVRLELERFNERTRVTLAHRTAEEIAELSRQLKAEVARREEEKKRREDAKPKITMPIPGKARKADQSGDEQIKIVIAEGSGKAILEKYRDHFKAAGWRDDESKIEEQSGSLRLTKEESALQFSFRDLPGEVDLDISATYASLSPDKSVPDFAELGGLPAATPVDAAELAKTPADIPIPSDARKLTVRPGKNIAFAVGADVKSAVDYFKKAMERHGWTFESIGSIVTDSTAALTFKKGKSPCSIALTNAFGGDLTSVTVAGGGVQWQKLRGPKGVADAPLASAPATK